MNGSIWEFEKGPGIWKDANRLEAKVQDCWFFFLKVTKQHVDYALILVKKIWKYRHRNINRVSLSGWRECDILSIIIAFLYCLRYNTHEIIKRWHFMPIILIKIRSLMQWNVIKHMEKYTPLKNDLYLQVSVDFTRRPRFTLSSDKEEPALKALCTFSFQFGVQMSTCCMAISQRDLDLSRFRVVLYRNCTWKESLSSTNLSWIRIFSYMYLCIRSGWPAGQVNTLLVWVSFLHLVKMQTELKIHTPTHRHCLGPRWTLLFQRQERQWPWMK